MKSFYFYAAGIMVLLLSILFFIPVQADANNTYTVDTHSLTIRSGPTWNSASLGYLHKGDKVTVFDTKFGWAQSYFDSQPAWVSPKYLQPVDNNKNIHKPKQEVKSTTSTKEEKNGPLDGYTIVLDPGHGGRDPGAIALDNTYEKDIALETVQKTAELLRESGAYIIVTREDDSHVSLNKRAKIGSMTGVDAFISFHYNSSEFSSLHGLQTFYYEGEENRAFARVLQKSLSKHLTLQDRGTMDADYRVLRKADSIAALLELGFLSNAEDLSVIKTESFQNSAAKAISEGIQSYFQ